MGLLLCGAREIEGAGWFVIVGESGGEPPHSRGSRWIGVDRNARLAQDSALLRGCFGAKIGIYLNGSVRLGGRR
jgi:hypothetical protein